MRRQSGSILRRVSVGDLLRPRDDDDRWLVDLPTAKSEGIRHPPKQGNRTEPAGLGVPRSKARYSAR